MAARVPPENHPSQADPSQSFRPHSHFSYASLTMQADRDFIDAGLKAAAGELDTAADRAGLHLHPATLRPTIAQRFRSRLRAIETIVRRLITLLAANLEPGPVRPGTSLPSGSVFVSTVPRFDLMPVDWTAPPPVDFSVLGPQGRPARRQPIDTAPLLKRLRKLFALMEHPDGAALRLARRIERLKTAGLERPGCGPAEKLHRFGHELGLIAAALPDMIGEAFASWYDTG